MSGPRDPELATALYQDLSRSVETFADLGEDTLGWFVYLQGAVLAGGWIDLDLGASATGESFHYLISNFPCYPLLAPYLESREWAQEEIIALKISHRLKR